MPAGLILDKQFPEYAQQMLYFTALSHDSRGGSRIICKKHKDETMETVKSAAKAEKLLMLSDDVDVYTTLNSYNTNKHRSENLWNISGIAIDLDCHKEDMTKSDYNIIIDRTWDKLLDLFGKGVLIKPSMAIMTGRGLQLYFILKNSISVRYQTNKMMDYYHKVRYEVTKAYETALMDGNYLTVDHNVLADTLLLRIPGTWNSKSNTMAELIYINEDADGNIIYYDLGEIDKAVSGQRSDKEVIDFTKKAMQVRLEKLTKLAELRKNTSVKSTKENMCFVYYSTAKMIYGDSEQAHDSLTTFNSIFKEPVSEEYLHRMCASTDKSVAHNGRHSGFYRIIDSQMIDVLRITDKENAVCDFWRDNKPICTSGAKIKPFRLIRGGADLNNARARASMTKRMKSLETLRDIRGTACTNNCRENMCHIYHAAAMVVYGNATDAEVATKLFNKGFSHPISDRELHKAMKSNIDHPRGYYQYKDATIIEKLGVTEEENMQCYFGVCKQAMEREQRHLMKVAERKALHKEIADMITDTDYTYQQIADFKGVGLSTVKAIAKEFGIKRLNTTAKEEQETAIEAVTSTPIEESKNLLLSSGAVSSSVVGEDYSVSNMVVSEGVDALDQLSRLDKYVHVYAEALSKSVSKKTQFPGQMSFIINEAGELDYYMIS